MKNGQILLYGKDINDYTRTELAKKIGFVEQMNHVARNDDSVRDYIVEGRTPYLSSFAVPNESDYAAAEECAYAVGCEALLDKRLSQLSGGELQMVLIARALTQDTPIIVMDEPMSALDLANQIVILKLIRELNTEGKTILLSTHNPNHAFVLGCQVGILNEGTVTGHGDCREVLTQDAIARVFGNGISILKIENDTYCEIDSMR